VDLGAKFSLLQAQPQCNSAVALVLCEDLWIFENSFMISQESLGLLQSDSPHVSLFDLASLPPETLTRWPSGARLAASINPWYYEQKQLGSWEASPRSHAKVVAYDVDIEFMKPLPVLSRQL
jgi:hypothetical protein